MAAVPLPPPPEPETTEKDNDTRMMARTRSSEGAMANCDEPRLQNGLQRYARDLSDRVKDKLVFRSVDDMKILRTWYAQNVHTEIEETHGTLQSLSSADAVVRYIFALSARVHDFIPLHSAIVIRETLHRIRCGAMMLDRSLLHRHVALCVSYDETCDNLDRHALAVHDNEEQETQSAYTYGLPIVELVKCAFIQDDLLFALLWTPFYRWIRLMHGRGSENNKNSGCGGKKRGKKRGNGVQEGGKDANGLVDTTGGANESMLHFAFADVPAILHLLASVCAQHGTHEQTHRIASSFRELSLVLPEEVRFLEFVERFSAPINEHVTLATKLLGYNFITAERLLERVVSMASDKRTHAMIAVLIGACVQHVYGLKSQARANISFATWKYKRTLLASVQTINDVGVLSALASMWKVAIGNTNAPKSKRVRQSCVHVCAICDGIDAAYNCGALVQIGLRTLDLTTQTQTQTQTQTRSHTPIASTLWQFVCCQDNAEVRAHMMCTLWRRVIVDPWAIWPSVKIQLRKRLPHSAVGVLLHYRLYEEMHSLCALTEGETETEAEAEPIAEVSVSVDSKRVLPLPPSDEVSMLPIALCRVARDDEYLDALHRFIITYPPTRHLQPILPKRWILDIARDTRIGNIAEVYKRIQPYLNAYPIDIFTSALKEGLPQLARASYSGDIKDVLLAFLDTSGGKNGNRSVNFGIHRRCKSLCEKFGHSVYKCNENGQMEYSVSTLYEALGNDDASLLIHMICTWPQLALAPPPADLWKRLKTALHPWCENARARASYANVPQNVFVAALRLRRQGSLRHLLTLPALLACMPRAHQRHSILCEALWICNAHVCRSLLHNSVVEVGACERACNANDWLPELAISE